MLVIMITMPDTVGSGQWIYSVVTPSRSMAISFGVLSETLSMDERLAAWDNLSVYADL